MGGRINTAMQACFFALANVLPQEEAIGHIKAAIRKSYGKRGEAIVEQNFAAIEKYSQDYRTLVQQQFQLKRELSELNTLFWFVDEFAWNKHSLLTPNT